MIGTQQPVRGLRDDDEQARVTPAEHTSAAYPAISPLKTEGGVHFSEGRGRANRSKERPHPKIQKQVAPLSAAGQHIRITPVRRCSPSPFPSAFGAHVAAGFPSACTEHLRGTGRRTFVNITCGLLFFKVLLWEEQEPALSSIMSSSAEPGTAREGTGKGTKRSPEEQPESQVTSGNDIGPPTTKIAKPNPPASDEDKNQEAQAATTTASTGAGAVVTVKPQGAGPTDSERVEAEALRSLGLGVGTRLEVMWLLEDDDKSVEKVRAHRFQTARGPLWCFFQKYEEQMSADNRDAPTGRRRPKHRRDGVGQESRNYREYVEHACTCLARSERARTPQGQSKRTSL